MEKSIFEFINRGGARETSPYSESINDALTFPSPYREGMLQMIKDRADNSYIISILGLAAVAAIPATLGLLVLTQGAVVSGIAIMATAILGAVIGIRSLVKEAMSVFRTINNEMSNRPSLPSTESGPASQLNQRLGAGFNGPAREALATTAAALLPNNGATPTGVKHVA